MEINTKGAENWGSFHISDNYGDYELARSNFFTLQVDDIDNLVRSDFELDKSRANPQTDILSNCQSALKLAVTKTSIPHFEVGVTEVRRGNSVIKYASVPSFASGTIEVEDYVDLHVKDILMAWQALAYDVVNDKGGRAINYKKRCTLIEYTNDGNKIREWEIIGGWISAISEDDFDVTADGERKISCTFQFDRAIMHTDF